jgi:hypothetical protein
MLGSRRKVFRNSKAQGLLTINAAGILRSLNAED